jgi:hypothetical protein
MGKLATLLMTLSLALPSNTDEASLFALGEEFCGTVIDSMAQGSYHFFDCLSYVKTVDYSTVNSTEQLIRNICSAAPDFYNLQNVVPEECVQAAKALNYF